MALNEGLNRYPGSRGGEAPEEKKPIPPGLILIGVAVLGSSCLLTHSTPFPPIEITPTPTKEPEAQTPNLVFTLAEQTQNDPDFQKLNQANTSFFQEFKNRNPQTPWQLDKTVALGVDNVDYALTTVVGPNGEPILGMVSYLKDGQPQSGFAIDFVTTIPSDDGERVFGGIYPLTPEVSQLLLEGKTVTIDPKKDTQGPIFGFVLNQGKNWEDFSAAMTQATTKEQRQRVFSSYVDKIYLQEPDGKIHLFSVSKLPQPQQVQLVSYALPTATPASIELTPTPQASPTPEPTPIPTIEVNGLQLPDPRITTELFDLKNPEAPIPQFANALKNAGIEVPPEQIVQGITFVSTKEDGTPLVDKDGNPFVVAVYNLDPSLFPEKYRDLAGPVPLMIVTKGENGEWRWRKVLLKDSDIIGINIGTLLGGYGFAEYYNDLVNVQRTHFNFGMVDTGAIAGWTGPNSYNYQYIDSDVRLGTKNQMNMMNHLLIWPSRIPDWLRNGNYSREQIMDFLKNWVKNTMKRYPQIKVWEVVNEYGNNDFFQQRLGNDYLLEVFRVAREARPDAILIYNDFANHSLIDRNFPNGQRTNHTQKVVETLRRQGLIDGVGIQMILYADNIPNKEDIVNTLRSYGIPVYITEFQVIMTNFKGNKEQRLLRQAEIYKMVCQAIIESGVSNTIIFFNQSDKVSPWENDPNLPQYSPNADPTLFDDNYQPKLAYYAVLQALFQQ
jgi:endo-1,4-beta-xylanase